MVTRSHYYWKKHRRHVANGRMAWYAEVADESFWYAHWKSQVSSSYLSDAEAFNLEENEVGRLLLRELDYDGKHLEAGCGAGRWVAALTHRGVMIEGIEYASGLVKLINSAYPQLPVRFGDALNIDVPDNYYDTYLSFGVVEHRVEGPEPFLSEAFRVVKPNGKVIISVPYFGPLRRIKARFAFYENAVPSIPFFQYGFGQEEFSDFILKAGFIIENSFPMNVHRLLLEEISVYRWLVHQRGGRFIKRAVQGILKGHDGHMLLVVGRKPDGSR